MIFADEHALGLALERGLVRPEEVDAARRQAPSAPLDALVAAGAVDATRLARALAEEAGVEFADLARELPSPDALAALSPHAAARWGACPLALRGGRLCAAVSDPTDLDAIDSLAFAAGRPVDPVVATAADIRRALASHHGWGQPADSAETEPSPAPDGPAGDDAPIVRAVQDIIAEAVRRRASDIHLEPLEHRFRVRYRVDGVLQETASPPRALQAAIVSRVKILADISIAERRVPQDGRIRLRLADRDLDLRVATLPTAHGESVVLRLLDRGRGALGLGELGLLEDDRAVLERRLAAPDGLILVTGPTGSGKTTTLYGALERLNDRGRKLITVEDPVEYQIPGVNQVPVNPLTGLTFAAALRAMLRQAPNVVMVGEIRDGETADIAVNAALTGHLVLSTLHTNDAPGALTRLLEIGVKPFLVAASLRLVVAQRLVRRVCPDCGGPHAPSPSELALLGLAPAFARDAGLRRGTGCPGCAGTGYRGRVGLFELLAVDDELRPLIYEPMTGARMREVARRRGMRTLREDGVRKVLAGLTTIEEVAAVTAEESVFP